MKVTKRGSFLRVERGDYGHVVLVVDTEQGLPETRIDMSGDEAERLGVDLIGKAAVGARDACEDYCAKQEVCEPTKPYNPVHRF